MAFKLERTWQEWRGFLLFIGIMLIFRSAIADWHQVPTGSMIPSILPSVQGGALVALHACGSLTDAALTHAHQGGARLTAVVPCCLQALGEGLESGGGTP